MKKIARNFIFWIPRVLGIVFALFVGMFAFDTFNEGIPFWQAFTGFLIHLLPMFLIVVLLVLAWKWEWIGAFGMVALGIAYIILTRGREHWSTYVFIGAPLLIIGVLFFIGWRLRTDRHPPDQFEDN